MNDEFERMWSWSILKIYCSIYWCTEVNYKEMDRIASVLSEVRKRGLPNTEY